MNKRFLALLVALCMLLVQAVALAEDGGAEPITLTAFSTHLKSPSDLYWGDDEVTRRITERTGITLDVSYAGTDDKTELMTMLAAGRNLPDLIVTDFDMSVISTMIGQGFVLPLRQTAEEYYPAFLETVPTDMDVVFDMGGDFYFVVDFYDDPAQPAPAIDSSLQSSLSVTKDIYEEMGSPDVSTLDLFIDHLVAVKDAYPSIKYPIFDNYAPSHILNLLARAYGLESNYTSIRDGGMTSNYALPELKEALYAFNRMYREGLINLEMFTMTGEQRTAAIENGEIYAFAGKLWEAADLDKGRAVEEIFLPILMPMPEGRSIDQMRMPSGKGGLGGWHLVFISKDCQDPARALEYLTFMYSEEGQVMQRYGVEGTAWTADADGLPKPTEAYEAADNDSKGRVFGVNNFNIAWFVSQNTINLGSLYTYENNPSIIKDFEINAPYCYNERIYTMSLMFSDVEDMTALAQLNDTFNKDVVPVLLSGNDDEFETAYQQLQSNLERSGLAQVNSAATALYQEWAAKLSD